MRNLLIGICLGALVVSAVASGPALMTKAIVPAVVAAEPTEITDPYAVAFSNEKIRQGADRLAQMYYMAKAITQEWTANPQLATAIAYDNPGVIVDGSATDGRNPVTGIEANNIITRLGEFVSDMEANGNAKLNTVLGVAVRPTGN